MDFLKKAGGILGRSMSNHISRDTSFSKPTVFQAVRWMSSSKLFVGGLSWSTYDASLKEVFNQYGVVADGTNNSDSYASLKEVVTAVVVAVVITIVTVMVAAMEIMVANDADHYLCSKVTAK